MGFLYFVISALRSHARPLRLAMMRLTALLLSVAAAINGVSGTASCSVANDECCNCAEGCTAAQPGECEPALQEDGTQICVLTLDFETKCSEPQPADPTTAFPSAHPTKFPSTGPTTGIPSAHPTGFPTASPQAEILDPTDPPFATSAARTTHDRNGAEDEVRAQGSGQLIALV